MENVGGQGEAGASGRNSVSLIVGTASNSTFLSPQSAAAAPSPVLGNIPPNDGMPGGPIPPGFFQVRAGPSFGPVLSSLQARLGQAGGRGREREVSSSSVCHGLNTVSLCWFKPFPSPPFVHPFQNHGGEKRNGEQTPPACAGVFLHTHFTT